jgi:hypothetical protein
MIQLLDLLMRIGYCNFFADFNTVSGDSFNTEVINEVDSYLILESLLLYIQYL